MGNKLKTPEIFQSELATLRKNMGAKRASTYGTRYGVLRRSRLHEESVAYQGETPSASTGKKGTVATWGTNLHSKGTSPTGWVDTGRGLEIDKKDSPLQVREAGIEAWRAGGDLSLKRFLKHRVFSEKRCKNSRR